MSISDTNKNQQKSFVTQAVILSLSGFAVKIIGVVFKIPLANVLDEGMGIFNAAYSIYAMLFMISTSGLPVAISRMVAGSVQTGKHTEAKKIFRTALIGFGLIGIICTLFLFFFADIFAEWSLHKDAVLAMKVISPTLFFICVVSAYRGYHQGTRNMNPTAISQFIEAFFKLVIGLGATIWARKAGYSLASQAAFAVSGVTVGAFLGLVFMVIYSLLKKPDVQAKQDTSAMSTRSIAKNLAIIALPVTITASAIYLSQFIDTLLIKKILVKNGMSDGAAGSLYSAYTTLAIPIADLLPSTLVYPISISILPAVAGAIAANNNKEADNYMHSSLRISGIISIFGGSVLFALARPSIALIYGVEWGKEIMLSNGNTVLPIDIGTRALGLLAIGVFFISLISTTNALLQALGKSFYPMISVLSGVVLLVVAEVILLNIESVGIMAAPISTLLCYFLTLGLNFYFLSKKTQHLNLSLIKLYKKPFFASLIAGGFAYGVYKALYWLWNHFLVMSPDRRLPSLVILMIAGFGSVFVYALTLLLIKGIHKEEILLLPMGRKLLHFIEKRGLI